MAIKTKRTMKSRSRKPKVAARKISRIAARKRAVKARTKARKQVAGTAKAPEAAVTVVEVIETEIAHEPELVILEEDEFEM